LNFVFLFSFYFRFLFPFLFRFHFSFPRRFRRQVRRLARFAESVYPCITIPRTGERRIITAADGPRGAAR
jgi:hypothetical protein